MGVQGLWKLLESAGKPIPVEKLENKVLSIDVSIWLYQIVKGVQDSEHGSKTNGHLIVMFHRICKLLFYGIKPIFVFDGGVPELKKITIAQRQAQKFQAKKTANKNKDKILKNMLEQAALKEVINPGNTVAVDEVISKTVKKLNQEEENDLFELPKLPEAFKIDQTPIEENEKPYLNLSKEKSENILLLAVQNQDNDFLYTDSVKDKQKSSPAKLNTFSSLQIGELLNGYSEDQKRLSERKTYQKPKSQMTFNELEMFLSDNNETNKKFDEFSQKIDSDHDTVFYYESDVNKESKRSCLKTIEMPAKVITSNFEKKTETKSKSTSQKIITTDAIGSPTLTEDIDEDIFKALAGDESLEEDRLAWLIFNENKKASKRRSSEFESPNLKCFKTEINDYSSEILSSDTDEDISTKNNKFPSKKHSSKSIYITEDEIDSDNFNAEDYLSWVSHTKDETNKIITEKKADIDYQNMPSTSKSLLVVDELPKKQSYMDSRNINKSIYFESKYDNREIYNSSPSIESDHSNGSFSENSLEFSPEESLSASEDDAKLDKKNKHEQKVTVFGSNKEVDGSNIAKIEPKEIKPTNYKKSKSPTKSNTNSTKLSEPFANQTCSIEEEHLLEIQDTLVKRQNDLASLQRNSDRIATSVTQKVTSDIKNLLKLFGIPYITAPMEAEAQCAFLEQIGRTEGTVTDDSDVWLFGANVVYKDFFDSKKYVKQFRSIDIKQKFALSRNKFIQLAFLVGSDYTNGVDGIGPVSAIEILSFFESKTKNMNIEEKLLKVKEIANTNSEVFSDLPFMKKLKKAKIGSDFPNKAVINAYLNPIVDESKETFNWGTLQVDSIVQFAQTNFDWDVSKTKNTLAPVLKKVSERTTQTSLDSYIKTLPKLSNTNTGMSKRVNMAVKRLRNDSSAVDSNKKSVIPKISTSTNSNDNMVKKRRKNLK